MGIGMAAGTLGSLAGLAFATGVAPVPGLFQLASHDSAVAAPGDDLGRLRASGVDDSPTSTTSTLVDRDTPTSTTSTSTTSTTVSFQPSAPAGAPAPAVTQTRTLDAAGAGTITYTVSGTTLTLVSANAASGWTAEVERAAGRELEVTFRSATGRVDVKVEFEDGQVRERVRPRTASDASPSSDKGKSDSSRAAEPGDDHGRHGSSSGGHGKDDGPKHS
jgi:hypothetical protein